MRSIAIASLLVLAGTAADAEIVCTQHRGCFERRPAHLRQWRRGQSSGIHRQLSRCKAEESDLQAAFQHERVKNYKWRKCPEAFGRSKIIRPKGSPERTRLGAASRLIVAYETTGETGSEKVVSNSTR
jgi:hypothetical protein